MNIEQGILKFAIQHLIFFCQTLAHFSHFRHFPDNQLTTHQAKAQGDLSL